MASPTASLDLTGRPLFPHFRVPKTGENMREYMRLQDEYKQAWFKAHPKAPLHTLDPRHIM
jgi:hypothetical protein